MKRRKGRDNTPVVGGIVGRKQHQRLKRRGPPKPVTDLAAALTEGRGEAAL